MEPFGLFQFLKTFLDSAPSERPPSSPENDVSTPQKEEFSPSQHHDNIEEFSSPVNAVLQFMDAHERRAKPHRKP